MKRIVLVTGGFDPIHSGHIEYFKYAKSLGDELWVGLNSDAWLTRKKGRAFMPFSERMEIVKNLFMVDTVLDFDDTDGSASGAIFKTKSLVDMDTKIIFANGGDRTNQNIPELVIYGDDPQVEFRFGVGGEDKKNSSSWILKEWSQPTTQRAWGTYTVLQKGEGWQVKELAFDTTQSLSDQRHFFRSEHWHVVKGTIKMKLEYPTGETTTKIYKSGESIDIPVNTWHQATNVGEETAKVIEVWLGDKLSEDDIERRENNN